MEELLDKLSTLKENLNNNVDIKKIKELNNKIKKDKELLNNIERYNKTQDENIRHEIINNKLFREYKLTESNINFIILEINKRLKEIINKGSSNHENN